MDRPPFTGDFDIGEFGVVDPWGEDSFKFNSYLLRWRQGKPPHFEPLLYVQQGGEPRLIGRYIKEHQVNIFQ